MANRRSASSVANASYTQFCIGVELGDETLVRDLVMRGANTMVSYGVDGVITTPMQSALKKGDVAMVMALLSSRSTKIKLADLDSAPKIKRELVTPVLLQRCSLALEDGAREMLLQRRHVRTSSRPQVKVSLPETITEHLQKLRVAEEAASKEASLADSDDVSTTSVSGSDTDEPVSPRLPMASSSDRPRCPPGDPAVAQDDDEASTGEEEEDGSDDEKIESASIPSSAEDSSGDEGGR